MGKEQDLERQLQELRKSKEVVLTKLDECMRLTKEQKARMWDDVVPIIKTAIERRMKDGTWDRSELKTTVFDKVMKSFGGENIFEQLDKF